MMRMFVDANILFSAAYTPAGRTARLFELAAPCGFELVSSDYAVNEAFSNLRRKKPEAVKHLTALLAHLQLTAWSAPEPCPVALKDKDKPILAAAIASQCDVLITGDIGDFGPYMDQPDITAGVRILTLGALLEAK